MPRVKRREREIERTRQDILEAAARVFSREGFAGATMQEIAREAGYTAPSLYTYFEGKDALLRELFRRFLAEALELFERPVPRGLSLPQLLELLFTSAMQLCDDRRDEMIAFANVANSGYLTDSLTTGELDGAAGPKIIIDRLAQWFEDKAGPGELGDLSAEEAAYFFYSVAYSRVLQWTYGGRKGSLVDEVPRALDLFMGGIRGFVREG